MTWRHLPPAFSPVTVGTLTAGLRGLSGEASALAPWLASHYAVDEALSVDSGTTALRLALESVAGAHPAAPVALPGYGCYDLATAALGAGIPVVLYDVDPATLGPAWTSLESLLARGVSAVVVVHLYGVPVDLDRARSLCAAANVPLIENAAQGAGAWWGNQRLGSLGDLGVLSFGRGKGMSVGGGGALLGTGARGRALLDRVRQRVSPRGAALDSWFRLVAQAALSHPLLYGIPARLPWLALGETIYHEPWPPRGIGRTEAGSLPVAAMLADREAELRREHAARFQSALSGFPGVSAVQPPRGEARPGWLRYPVVLRQPHALGTSARARELGLMPGYPKPLFDLPVWGPQLAAGDPLPGARRLAERLVTLPTHRWLRSTDQAALVQLLRT